MDLMRVGGLASGMDIEEMVDKLMEAERMPLTRLQQQQTSLTWKRDAFRSVNSKLLELDKMMLDMKLSNTYKPKSVASSQDGAVTATADANATNGSYNVEVSQLAKNEMWSSEGKIDKDIELSSGTYTFSTYDESGKSEHEFTVTEDDNLQTVLKKIGEASDGRVRAFYDESSQKVVLETTRTGIYNTMEDSNESAGPEIEFDENSANFFKQILGSNDAGEIGNRVEAQNAEFKYNGGLELESKTNSYSINGIHFEFNNKTEGDARLTVSTNVDDAFDKITNFIDQYNETIEAMNESQTEEKFRDYKPLTDEQKAEMSDKEIEQWEEKAKSGILRGESSIRDGMFSLRQSMQSYVETGGEYNLLSQIGITTTKNYLDGGKLEVDEDKLKAALRNNPDDVYKLFSNGDKESGRGLINRFDDSLDRLRGKIEQKAGKSTNTLENYSIGKQMKELNERITNFEKRMVKVEERYWSQFTQMEKAISQLNQQSEYLYSQFNG